MRKHARRVACDKPQKKGEKENCPQKSFTKFCVLSQYFFTHPYSHSS